MTQKETRPQQLHLCFNEADVKAMGQSMKDKKKAKAYVRNELNLPERARRGVVSELRKQYKIDATSPTAVLAELQKKGKI